MPAICALRKCGCPFRFEFDSDPDFDLAFSWNTIRIQTTRSKNSLKPTAN
jgi:hypothetical protein